MATTTANAGLIGDYFHNANRLLAEALKELERASYAWSTETDPVAVAAHELARDLVGATRLVAAQVTAQTIDWGNIEAVRGGLTSAQDVRRPRRQPLPPVSAANPATRFDDDVRLLADDTFNRIDWMRRRRGLAADSDELETAVTWAFGGGSWTRWKQWHVAQDEQG